MPEKYLNEISSHWQELYQKGCASLNQGDADTAITLFTEILDAEPRLVVCREALRRAQLLRAQKNHGFLKRTFEEMRELPELAEAETYLHIQPFKAIRMAEEILNHIPDSVRAHKILAQAALKANMPRTALLSLNFIYNRITENITITLELAEALAETGCLDEALAICGRLQKDYPENKCVLRTVARLAQMAFDARTTEMANATARRTFKSPAANYGLGKNWGARRSGSATRLRGTPAKVW